MIKKIIVLFRATSVLIGLRLNFVEDILSWVGYAVPNFRGIGAVEKKAK